MYMSILIEIPGHFIDKSWCNNKTCIWKTHIFDIGWYDIFEYINDRFDVPIDSIRINNSCKLYRYNNIDNYPLFQSIMNEFRYIDLSNNKYTNTLVISTNIYIRKKSN